MENGERLEKNDDDDLIFSPFASKLEVYTCTKT